MIIKNQQVINQLTELEITIYDNEGNPKKLEDIADELDEVFKTMKMNGDIV